MKSYRRARKITNLLFFDWHGCGTVLLSVRRKCYKIANFCNNIDKELLGLSWHVIIQSISAKISDIRGSKLLNILRSSFFVPTFTTVFQPVRACPAGN